MATWNNPNPFANPLNSLSMNGRRSGLTFRPGKHSELTVPDTSMPNFKSASELTVPNQDIGPGVQAGGCGFVNDRIFVMSDGSAVDFKTGRIVMRNRNVPEGHWNDPRSTARSFVAQDVIGSWNASDGPSMAEMVSCPEKFAGIACPDGSIETGMTKEDIAYWLRAEEEAEKLRDAMTDEQKSMLSAFEAHFPKSRLIEESKRLEPHNLKKEIKK